MHSNTLQLHRATNRNASLDDLRLHSGRQEDALQYLTMVLDASENLFLVQAGVNVFNQDYRRTLNLPANLRIEHTTIAARSHTMCCRDRFHCSACGGCRNGACHVEKVLQLDIANDAVGSIGDAISQFCKEEQLDSDTTCQICFVKGHCSRKRSFSKMPPTLRMALIRFRASTDESGRIITRNGRVVTVRIGKAIQYPLRLEIKLSDGTFAL